MDVGGGPSYKHHDPELLALLKDPIRLPLRMKLAVASLEYLPEATAESAKQLLANPSASLTTKEVVEKIENKRGRKVFLAWYGKLYKQAEFLRREYALRFKLPLNTDWETIMATLVKKCGDSESSFAVAIRTDYSYYAPAAGSEESYGSDGDYWIEID